MIKLKIDLSDLELAFENSSYECFNYLDLQTGEVILFSDDYNPEGYDPDAMDDSDRYRAIPRQNSDVGYQVMETFIETVQDTRLQAELSRAIARSKPFRQFKDTLRDFPEEENRWFQFEQQHTTQRILEWLEAEGIELIP